MGRTRVVLQKSPNDVSHGFQIRGGKEVELECTEFRYYISEIDPEGLACKNGLQVGDRIVKVNSEYVQNLEYTEVVKLFSDNDTITLLIEAERFTECISNSPQSTESDNKCIINESLVKQFTTDTTDTNTEINKTLAINQNLKNKSTSEKKDTNVEINKKLGSNQSLKNKSTSETKETNKIECNINQSIQNESASQSTDRNSLIGGIIQENVCTSKPTSSGDSKKVESEAGTLTQTNVCTSESTIPEDSNKGQSVVGNLIEPNVCTSESTISGESATVQKLDKPIKQNECTTSVNDRMKSCSIMKTLDMRMNEHSDIQPRNFNEIIYEEYIVKFTCFMK